MTRLAGVLVVLLVGFVLVGCGSTVTTRVIPVQMPLPEREEAIYRVQDDEGRELGRATLRIAPDPVGNGLALTQSYDFGEGRLDQSMVMVDRQSMRPKFGEREVLDNGERFHTAMTYAEAAVTVIFTGERGERTRTAEISETAYDNLESLFLWRTIGMGAGERVSYVTVVVDPKRGTISRALATVEVSGREIVTLAEGPVEAWRVDFTSAGVTNYAWYAVTDDRRLVKYEIARGPTLLLERISR